MVHFIVSRSIPDRSCKFAKCQFACYVDWLTCKRMAAVGLNCHIKTGSHPLPWTQKWIAGAEVQVAPQETEISSYVIGGTKQDVDQNTFKGFSL